MQCENENICLIINPGMRKSSQFSHHVRHSKYTSTLLAFLQANLISICQKFSFSLSDSSLSILVSDKWFKRCWWLWNVYIGVTFNYSYIDLITRLWRYFGFVIPHSFLSNDGFLVLTNTIMLEIKIVSNPCQETCHLFLNLLISFFLLYSWVFF